MKRILITVVLAGLVLTAVGTRGVLHRVRAFNIARQQQTGLLNRTFVIDGIERTALIRPGSGPGAPLVFVFHGHGGNARAAATKFQIHELWRDATVVYMQGIPGVAGITDAEGRLNGWQKNAGEVGDRDLKFFDAALDQIQKELRTDPKRVYAFGHSNGARFVYVLWNKRGEKFAALAAASAPGGVLIQTSVPKSIFVIAGKKDELVPFEGQALSINLVRKRLATEASKASSEGYVTTEPGKDGTELVTYVHPGGHAVPPEALPLVVKFFQKHQ